ncbi:MAG TPA: VWA domain-containing protein, partial [Myxococcota bacterium]
MLHVAVALVALVAPAVSSSSSCPRGDAPGPSGALRIDRVDVDVRLDDDVAHASWTIALVNTGDGPAKAVLDFTVDTDDGSAVPLVVDRVQRLGHAAARIEDADVASERFETFVMALEHGVEADDVVAGNDHAAVIAALHDRHVKVDVAAACSVRRLVVRVDGGVLSRPRAGGLRYQLPRLSPRDRLHVVAADRDVWVGGRALPADGRIAPGAAVMLSETDDDTDDDDGVDDDRHGDHRLDVRPHSEVLRASGLIQRAGDHRLVQLGVDVPAQLSVAPADMRFVFVVDGSVSAGDAGVTTALRQVQHVLDAAPHDARWAMVVAGRTPHVLVSPWRDRDDRFVPDIDVENGSDIAAAVDLAVGIATDVDDIGAARVIVVSDLQQRAAHTEALDRRMRHAQLPGDDVLPIVHLVRLPPDTDVESRLKWSGSFSAAVDDDGNDHAVRGGIGVHTWLDGTDADEAAIARHLVVPTRLDDVDVLVDSAQIDDPLDDSQPLLASQLFQRDGTTTSFARTLREGEHLRLTALLPKAHVVEVRARAWNEPLLLTTSAIDRAVVVGTAINGAFGSDLDDDVVTALATPLHLVSRTTALVDVPKWRPAIPDDLGWGSSGCGCGCGMRHDVGFGSRTACGVGAPRSE